MFKPITKWNARLNSPAMIPEAVRKAFKVAQAQKPGPTHIELPEDVMAADAADIAPLPHRQERRRPEPSQGELDEAAEMIRDAEYPLVLAGNGISRGDAAPALRAFAHATGMGVAATFMGKGVMEDGDPHWRGTVGMQARDYELAGFDHADVVITVGYDLVEHAPANWNPKKDKTIICIDTVAAEVDEHFVTASDLIGDIDLILRRLTGLVAMGEPATTTPSKLEELVQGAFRAGAEDDAFPMHPPRVLWEIRKALAKQDILISDVGMHKLWIARMFPASEPDTVLIANGLAGMGIALPTAIAAQLVHPDRKVVTVSGDGGFLMNCQELETAKRMKTPIVNVIWENQQFGSIVWKQDAKFGRHFGVDFTNPDFVQLAQAFGLPGFRCESVEDFPAHLDKALSLDEPSIVVVPIDYSQDIALEELGKETVAA
jgi:acetolactate synthase-1/2/3 large subunit